MQVDMRRDRHVGELVVVRAVGLAQDREAQVRLERLQGGIEHGDAVQAGHLRRRVHDGGTRRVLHRLADEHAADLPPQLLDLVRIGCRGLDHRQVELLGQRQALVVAEPGLERGSPLAGMSGSMPFSAITLVSARGMWAILVTTAPLAEQT